MPLPIEDLFARPCVNEDPTGEQGSGGTAVAHRPSTGAVAAPLPLPDARLFRTCIAAIEPTLGVTADGSVFYTAVDDISAEGLGTFHFTPVVMRSQDAGATWEPVFAGNADTLDPYTHVDKATSRVFTVDYNGCHFVSWSDDLGETWTTNGLAGCAYNTDHQTLFSGAPATRVGAAFPSAVYLCSISHGLTAMFGAGSACSKSMDGGATFLPSGEPAFLFPPAAGVGALTGGCLSGNGHGFVGHDGTVYLPRGHCGQPWLAISRDEGLTWRHVQVADNGMPTGFGLVDHEAAVGADEEGNLYYFWVAKDRLPYLAVSRDGGATWSAPWMVAPPGVNEASLAAMDVGAPGKVALAYLCTTTSPGGPTFPEDADAWEATTWNGCVSAVPDALSDDPLVLSTTINDPSEPLVVGTCGPVRCQSQFDFIDVQVGPEGAPWFVFVDGCTSERCYMIGEGIVGTLVGGPDLWAGGLSPY